MEGNISWSELLNNAIVTTQHGNDGNRIAATTETPQQTAHQFVQLLNERARLLANSAQFDTALRDAAALRALLPESGRGYLTTGDVHCQQGRYAAAISIYDQGLEAVPESDPCYQQLQQQREKAIANNDKRIDFIIQLPLDIVTTHIIPRMQPKHYSESSCEHLFVSRAWQARILQQPNGLRFHFGRDVNTFNTGHDQLVQFAPNVQSLSGSIDYARLDDLISRANFSNLKELDITCADTTPRLPLIHGLQKIADPLTHLTLCDCPGLQLRDILETCPNLVFLGTSDLDTIMPLSSSHPKIQHLSLFQNPERGLTHEQMDEFLTRFPSLRVLEISPMADSSLLPLLHKHCPYLEVIVYGLISRIFREPLANVHPNRRGITLAYLHGRESYMQDDLIQFLHQHRDSLQVLYLYGDIQVNDDALWTISNGHVRPSDQQQQQQPPDYNPSFPQLDDLRCTHFHRSATIVQMMLWTLLNAHNLTTIHIHDLYFRPDIANAIMNLKHLQKVYIDAVNKEDDDGIPQFLMHHIALGDQSTLEHVVVDAYHVNMSRKPWVILLAALARLKSLELLARVIFYDCIPIMKAIGKGCPALEKSTLGIDGVELADGLVVFLHKHPNIKYLTIGSTSLSGNDIMALCTFRGLQQLHLPFPVADDLLEMLIYHIPSIKIDPP